VTRRYINKNVGELEALAAANQDDLQVIADIIDELGHRRSPRARDLLASLTGGPASGSKSPGKSSSRTKRDTGRSGTKAGSSGPTVEAEPAVQCPAVNRSLEQTYETLRETFTFEAETLARWGVTPLLPEEIRRNVFDHWRARLTNIPDERGRSIETLERDLARLATQTRSEF